MSSYSDAANTIAQLYLQKGAAQAEGSRNIGQLLGGAVANIGQTIQNYPAQQAQMREAQQRAEMGDIQIRQARQQERAQQIMGEAYKNATNPDGSVNYPAIGKTLVDNGLGSYWPELQAKMAAAAKSGADLKEQYQKLDAAERAQMGHIAEAAGAVPDAADQATIWTKLVTHAANDGSIDPSHARDSIAQMLGADGNPDPQKVKTTIETAKRLAGSKPVTNETELALLAAGGDPTKAIGILKPPPREPQPTEASLALAAAGGDPSKALTTLQGPALANSARADAAQKATEANQIATRKQEDQRIALERQRVGLEGQRLAKGIDGEQVPAVGNVNVPDVAPGQRNEDYLKTLPTTQANLVKGLTEGRLAFPSGFALKSPYWQGLLQAVSKYDPSFDAVNYNARAKTRADFTSGKSAQQVNAINTVIGHLAGLSDAAEALHNGNYPALNSIANALSKATGNPKVTNFDTIKKAVSDEVTRVWRQSGGSEADIQAAQKNLDAAGSPAQLRGAIATYADLLQSKLGSLNEQYRQGMGTDKIDILTPASRKALDVLEQRAGKQIGSTQSEATYKVGQQVNYKGQTRTVTAVHPDGTIELK